MATSTSQLDLQIAPEVRSVRRPLSPEQRTPLLEIVAALRTVGPLDGLTEEEYTWIATHGEERIGADGTLLFQEDEPACNLNFILRGEIQVRRRRAGPIALFTGRAGQMTGKLPFSRMKSYGGDGYSVGPIWSIDLHESRFPELLAAIPSMGQRCVSILLDRVREFTRMEQQAEKLSALGKLAANLAHELNNPASAAQRSAASLFTELGEYGGHKFRLGALGLDAATCDTYRLWARDTRLSAAGQTTSPDALQVADREDAILTWLQAHNIPEPWKIAPSLAESNLDLSRLDELDKFASPDMLPLATAAFASTLRVERMAETVLNSTVRIFDLISAIKDYSYMDQALIQQVDIAQSLETTLAMFNSRISDIHVEVDFDPGLPPIRAYGSELNQVWTALIENAIDAINSQKNEESGFDPDGKAIQPRPRGTIRLSTRLSGRYALVEVADTGPGIPSNLKSRIFEPFFTTKPPGQGLGLGLDTVQRIVGKHLGFVTVDTSGPTCFQIRLPLDQAEAY